MDYENQKPTRKVPKTDKQIVGIFVFLGFFALIFGFLNFRQNLREPFKTLLPDYNIQTNEQERASELLALKATDSDNDGLSDFDELYQFQTSPYIADSDSDGFSDSEEIGKGADPNCPEGWQCLQTRTETTNGNINGYIKASELTPAQLRQILLENGIPQVTLDKMDDETLMKLYNEVIAETGTMVGEEEANINQNGNSNSPYTELLSENINIETSTSGSEDLSNLSAYEIRELLKNTGGIDEETLANISDEQLVSIFQQSLANQEENQ